MNQNRSKTFNTRFLWSLFCISLTCFWTLPVSANSVSEADVGITFKQTEDDTPSPQNNTPEADKAKPINKRVSLPNTGETVRQLTWLISGMIIIVIGFVVILDRQVKLSSD